MKIVEPITPINAHKVFLGKKEIDFTLDTETGELTIDSPAMFTDPIVKFEDLKATIDKLAACMNLPSEETETERQR